MRWGFLCHDLERGVGREGHIGCHHERGMGSGRAVCTDDDFFIGDGELCATSKKDAEGVPPCVISDLHGGTCRLCEEAFFSDAGSVIRDHEKSRGSVDTYGKEEAEVPTRHRKNADFFCFIKMALQQTVGWSRRYDKYRGTYLECSLECIVTLEAAIETDDGQALHFLFSVSRVPTLRIMLS